MDFFFAFELFGKLGDSSGSPRNATREGGTRSLVVLPCMAGGALADEEPHMESLKFQFANRVGYIN
jgi:hypothetical protein